MRKHGLPLVSSLLIGCFIGYFGVYSSITGEVSDFERLVVILVILGLYLLLSLLLGLFFAKTSWRIGIAISLPAIVLLLMNEPDGPMFLYIGLLCILSVVGSLLGGIAGRWLQKKL